MREIWILGATGRVGRAVAERLAAQGAEITLVGRDRERLAAAATKAAGNVRILQADSLSATTGLIAREQPAVVINTIGPFTESAMPVIDACLPGSDYLDVTNELPSMTAVLDRDTDALAAGRTLVTATGFGVLGTEAAVLTACQDLTNIDTVRVDAMPLVAPQSGRLGEALAASLVGGLAQGGLRYAGGRRVRAAIGGRVETITAPDGATIRTGCVPTGDLEAARRASGAPNVIAASSLLPTALPGRALITIVGGLARVGWIRAALVRRMAGFEQSTHPDPDRKLSWARAQVRTTGGKTRTAWLRTNDAMDFTTASTAEIATRLARGEGRPGAYTPGALFGPELAESAGAEFMID